MKEIEMKRKLFTILMVLFLLAGCAAPTMQPNVTVVTELPQYLIDEVPGIYQCVKAQKDIQWDESVQMVMGGTSSVLYGFDSTTHKVTLEGAEIGGQLSKEQQKAIFWKETCNTAAALQGMLATCLTSWDPVRLCLPEDLFDSAVDAIAFSYLSEFEQRLFVGANAPTIHLQRGDTLLTCQNATIFKAWSDNNFIFQADWNILLTAPTFGCNP